MYFLSLLYFLKIYISFLCLLYFLSEFVYSFDKLLKNWFILRLFLIFPVPLPNRFELVVYVLSNLQNNTVLLHVSNAYNYKYTTRVRLAFIHRMTFMLLKWSFTQIWLYWVPLFALLSFIIEIRPKCTYVNSWVCYCVLESNIRFLFLFFQERPGIAESMFLRQWRLLQERCQLFR